jgi:hypothetical protein
MFYNFWENSSKRESRFENAPGSFATVALQFAHLAPVCKKNQHPGSLKAFGKRLNTEQFGPATPRLT